MLETMTLNKVPLLTARSIPAIYGSVQVTSRGADKSYQKSRNAGRLKVMQNLHWAHLLTHSLVPAPSVFCTLMIRVATVTAAEYLTKS